MKFRLALIGVLALAWIQASAQTCYWAGQILYASNVLKYCNGGSYIPLTGSNTGVNCTKGGEFRRNGTTAEYCNGTKWINMVGTVVYGACSEIGRINFNAPQMRYEFCNGTNWMLMQQTTACTTATTEVGRLCADGTIFAGSNNGFSYIMTPGNCTDSATPTCDATLPPIKKKWQVTPSLTELTSLSLGQYNSNKLATNFTGTDAATYCENMVFAGYDDWYLPAVDEIYFLAGGKSAGIPGLSSATDKYWVSTESDTTMSYTAEIRSDGGGYGVNNKTSLQRVRCIRKVNHGLVPPTNLALTGSNGSRIWSVSWTAGVAHNAPCKLQYFKNESIWVDAPVANVSCNTTTMMNIEFDKHENWTNNFDATGVKVRLAHAYTDASIAEFPQRATCVMQPDPATATPNVDENCNSKWFDEGPDACAGSPAAGTYCLGGALAMGTLSGATYMTTPGGCGEIPVAQRGGGTGVAIYPNADFTPTCSGTDELKKSWNNSVSMYTYNHPELADYTGSFGAVGAANIDVNFGDYNTYYLAQASLSDEGGIHASAHYCDRLDFGGYTDWYLPNRYELYHLYAQRAVIPGLNLTNNSVYWSSTEYGNSGQVWAFMMKSAAHTVVDRRDGSFIRCVRRTPASPTSLVLTHTPGERNATVSWNAGVGTGPCKIQFEKNGTTWTDIPKSFNCAGTGGAIRLPEAKNWTNNFNTTGVKLRLVSTFGSSVYGEFPQRATCTIQSNGATSTPDTDENCNGIWDDDPAPCSGSTSPGAVCERGAIYLGSLNSNHYQTTAGGCEEIPAGQIMGSGIGAYPSTDFTPTCAGNDVLTKSWKDSAAFNYYDVPGITNYTTTLGTGKGGVNVDTNLGDSNTQIMAAITSTIKGGNHAAARYCSDLVLHGYTDWYLPNRAELNIFWTNRVSIPGLNITGTNYQSSSERSNQYNWIQSFNNGYQNTSWKELGSIVRCVRRI